MAYCTKDDIANVLSQEGLFNATNDTGEAAHWNSTLVTAMIAKATQRIDMYVSQRYKGTDLDGNAWVQYCAAVLAAAYLWRRLGRALPTGLQQEFDEYIGLLKEIRNGEGEIPNVAPRYEPGLAMSNLTFDARYRNAKIRRQASISAGDTASTKVRHTDYRSEYDAW